jgi:SAM-dependent methyltransferase
VHGHERGDQRFDPAAQAAEWDARYSERDGVMWSGRPNGRLVAEVADLPPGRALDVGCGEGADAILLAGRSWTVAAIDISDLALRRARKAARLGRASTHRPAPRTSPTSSCAPGVGDRGVEGPSEPERRAERARSTRGSQTAVLQHFA